MRVADFQMCEMVRQYLKHTVSTIQTSLGIILFSFSLVAIVFITQVQPSAPKHMPMSLNLWPPKPIQLIFLSWLTCLLSLIKIYRMVLYACIWCSPNVHTDWLIEGTTKVWNSLPNVLHEDKISCSHFRQYLAYFTARIHHISIWWGKKSVIIKGYNEMILQLNTPKYKSNNW